MRQYITWGWPAGLLVSNMNMTFILTASLFATVFIVVFANIFGCWNDDNDRRRGRRHPRQSSTRTKTKIKYPKPDGNVSPSSRILGQSLQPHAHFADLAVCRLHILRLLCRPHLCHI